VAKIMIANRSHAGSDVVGWMIDESGGVQGVNAGAVDQAAGEQGRVIVIDPGNDGPITVITVQPDGTVTVEHQPAHPDDALTDAAQAVKVIREAAQLKAPGLTEATVRGVSELLLQDAASRYPDAGLVVFG
jgi:hypothetical protein